MSKSLQEYARSHASHVVRDTSVQAWLSLSNLGQMQQLVYECIEKRSREGLFPTDREVAKDLGLSDPNAVRPRRFELMQMGLVVEAGKRTCSVTEKLVLTWKVVDVEPLLEFVGATAKQTRYLAPEDWAKLRDIMVRRGYHYKGNYVWRREAGVSGRQNTQ